MGINVVFRLLLMFRVFGKGSILFIFLCTTLYAQPIFKSDFELGETYIAQAYSPTQQEMVLIENDKLDEWILTGGSGIIENSISGEKESFQYAKREGNVLIGVKGLTKEYSKFDRISAGGLYEWYKLKPRSENDLTVSTENVLFGSYSANINLDHNLKLDIGRDISPDVKEFYIRFYMLFSDEIFHSEMLDFSFFNVKFKDFYAPRVFLVKEDAENYSIEARNIIENPKSQSNYSDIEKLSKDTFEILPNKKYCIEYYIHYSSSDTCQFSLFCNGEVIYNTSIKLIPFEFGLSYFFWIGKSAIYKNKGNIYFDEVVFDTKPIGTIPEQPIVAFSDKILKSTPFSDVNLSEKHSASHWQISDSRNWMVLEYNSGEEKDNLTSLNLDSLDLDKTIDKDYYARVRYKNSMGNWSDWSETLKFKCSSSNSDVERRTEVIKDLFFTMPNTLSPVEYIQPETWYDIHVYFTKSAKWDRINYIYLGFYTDTEHNVAFIPHDKNKWKFDPYSSYNSNISLNDRRIWSKQTEGLPILTDIYNMEGLYIDDDFEHLIISEDENKVIIRMKFLSQAKKGKWVVEGCAVDMNNKRLQPYRNTFFMGISQQSKSVSLVRVVLIGLLLVVGIVVCYLYWSSKKKKNNDKVLEDVDEPDDFLIKNIITYIDENLSSDLMRNTIAQEFNINPSWLSTYFHQKTNEKLSQYINKCRIEYAKELLKDPKYNITEIAIKSGFGNLSSFDRVFKSLEHKSPKQYRNTFDL